MPRWLLASVIALVLSCFGFATVAHGAMHAPGHRASVAAAESQQQGQQQGQQEGQQEGQQQTQPEAPAPLAHDATDTEEPSALQDENNAEWTEAAIGGLQPAKVEFLSYGLPRPALSAPPSPFLPHPKRPPRAAAFLL